jgi:protein tyrosine/serine phosphatase
VDKLKIKTIIDLRTPTEHLEQAREAAPTTPTSPAVSSKHPTQAFHIPGIDYVDVNFNGSSYSDALIKQLTWSQTAKLYSLYILGYRKSAISVLGTNVMAARGLAGLAEDSLTHCQKEVKEVFDVLCDRSRYPVVVHCTQGKDRTGLIVLLVLMLCDVSLEAIEKDYQLSGKELEPERAERVEEIRSIGLPDSFADCEEGWARRVAEFVENRFGGVEGYLDGCGIGKEQRIALRDSLVER